MFLGMACALKKPMQNSRFGATQSHKGQQHKEMEPRPWNTWDAENPGEVERIDLAGMSNNSAGSWKGGESGSWSPHWQRRALSLALPLPPSGRGPSAAGRVALHTEQGAWRTWESWRSLPLNSYCVLGRLFDFLKSLKWRKPLWTTSHGCCEGQIQ